MPSFSADGDLATKRLEQAPDGTLDLHGKTVQEARQALEAFVHRSASQGLHRILVITGKGLSNQQRRGVLKTELEAWVRRRGARHLHAFSEAPRALGGAGAYLLYLRR